MAVFRCVACNQAVSRDVGLLAALPSSSEWDAGSGERPDPTIPCGSYSIDPEPFGAPFVPSTRLMADGCPESVRVAGGPRETVVLHPEDAAGLVDHADHRRQVGCCGPDGMNGPNKVCGCGAEIGTLRADCWSSQELRLHPARVWLDRTGAGGGAGRPC
jgi:hypothetical protein